MRARLARYACCLGLLGAGLAVLPSCTALVADAPFFKGNDVNLLEINDAAADMLAHQSKGMLKPGTPVRVGTLVNAYPDTDIDSPARAIQPDYDPGVGAPVPAGAPPEAPKVIPPAPFGKVVAEQIAGRWVDLGFNVIGGSGLARPGQAILGGQYARANGRVLISLRLRDAGTGRVLGAYDYSIPISSEINDLLGKDEHQGFFKF